MRSADAATRTWNVTSGTGVWQTSGNWLTAAPADSTTTDTARFSNSNGNQTAQLNANTSIAGLTFAQTGSTTLTSDSATTRTLTIGTTGVTINAGAGAVTLGNAGSPLNVAISGAQSWTNNTAPANRFIVLGGITSSAASGTQTLTVTGTGDTLFSGDLANGSSGGTFSLVKSGNGTLTLSGNNTYTGTTTSSAGMLALPQRQSLYGANTANWTQSFIRITGGTLALNMGGTGEFTDADVQTLTSGTLFSGGNATWLALDTSNATGPVTFSGNFSNSTAGTNISFAKLGAGTLIVAGTIGTTSSSRTVASGTLQIGTATTAGSVAGSILNNATIVFETQQGSMGGVISGTGQVIKKGNTQLGVTSDQTYTGLTTIESGTVRCQDGGATAGWLAGDVLNNGVLSLNRNAAKEFVGAISGTGSLVIAGVNASSNVILTNSSSFTGGTTINSGGRLTIGNGGTTGSIVGNVANAGTLGFNRSDAISFSGTISGGGGLLKEGAGTLTLSAANTYTGTTSVNAGVLALSGVGTLGGTTSRLALGGGSLDLGGLSRTVGNVSVVAGATSGDTIQNGTLTGTAFSISNSSGTATVSAILAGASAALTKSGAGVAVLSAANSFTGNATIGGGLVNVSTLGNAGTAGELGAGTTISIGSATESGTLRYTGAGNTTSRTINLVGSGGVVSDGSGPLVFSSAFTDGGSGSRVFTLGGTSPGTNQLVSIAGSGVSVNKTGPSLWRLTGNSSYDGPLSVLDGTIVAGGNVGSLNSPSPLGQKNPVVGVSTVAATGTAALLLEGGFSIVRQITVDTLGSGTSQVAVLGATGTGVATFGNGSIGIWLGRSVTLQASGSATARFWTQWLDGNGNANPVVAYTIGSAGNAGIVQLETELPTSATGVSVVNGTAQLVGSEGEKIATATPVTVGSTLGAATLDLNGLSQSISRLTFAGNSGSVTTGTTFGGRLRLVNSGSVSVSGTDHVVSSLVDLVVPTTFDTGSASVLTVSNVISSTSGAVGLTKSGLGTLTLSGSNTYTGMTSVAAGRLAVNGSLAGGVTVQSAATLGGSGVISGNLTGDGLIAPGNSPGILTVDGQITPTGTTSFAFEFTGTGSPTWSNASASVNDVLRLTNADPFATSLASGNVVNIYFDRPTLANGDEFLGGFYIDNPLSTSNLLTGELGSATFQYFVKGDGLGSFNYNGTNYYSFEQFAATASGITGVTRSVVNVASADFSGGTITTGQVTQFVIVPEPGAISLSGIGIAAAAWAARRRGR